MIEDRYESIDELINHGEKALLVVVDCINNLCDPHSNLKRISQ